MSIVKHNTNCCALATLAISDDTPKVEIEEAIKLYKQQAFSKKYNPQLPDGQRAVLVVTTPSEKNLRKNLRELGFRVAEVFDRRNGYENTGKLTMWTLTW